MNYNLPQAATQVFKCPKNAVAGNCYLWQEFCYLLTMPIMLRKALLCSHQSVFVLRRVSVCKLTLTLPLTATLFNKLVAEDRSEKTQTL